jgi:hypothetical protein
MDDALDYSCMLQLPPTLTSLNMSVPALRDTTAVQMTPEAAGYMAQLTQLRDLQCALSWPALGQLTALTNLTRLCFDLMGSDTQLNSSCFTDSHQCQVGGMGNGRSDCAVACSWCLCRSGMPGCRCTIVMPSWPAVPQLCPVGIVFNCWWVSSDETALCHQL